MEIGRQGWWSLNPSAEAQQELLEPLVFLKPQARGEKLKMEQYNSVSRCPNRG